MLTKHIYNPPQPSASLRRASSNPGSVRDPVTGFTCLHHAALNGHTECVALILSRGACKLNATDYKGSSALHLASWAGNLQVVRTLLCHHNGPASHPSSAAELQQELAQVAKDELEVDLLNNDQQTALSLAAQFGHNDVVRLLLEQGANCQLRNKQLESPLDLACSV